LKYQSYAKKTTNVPTAVPVSRAAESTSTIRKGGMMNLEKHVIGSTLTVVFCPPIEMSFPNHIVEYETNERPGDKVHSSCWRYLGCASQHHRDAE
jgi:hypothetical protein